MVEDVIMRSKRMIINIAVFLIAILTLYFLEYKYNISNLVDLARVQSMVENTGVKGVMIFILVLSIRQVFILPSGAVFVMAGVVFGTVLGSIYCYIGHMINCLLAYFVGLRFKKLGKRFISEKYLLKLNSLQGEDAFRRLFTMRTIPGFPVDPISFGAGIVEVDFNAYYKATALGAIPKVFMYTYLGEGLKDIFSINTIIMILFMVLLSLSPYLTNKKTLLKYKLKPEKKIDR